MALSGMWGISLHEGFQKTVYCSDNGISFADSGIESISINTHVDEVERFVSENYQNEE